MLFVSRLVLFHAVQYGCGLCRNTTDSWWLIVYCSPWLQVSKESTCTFVDWTCTSLWAPVLWWLLRMTYPRTVIYCKQTGAIWMSWRRKIWHVSMSCMSAQAFSLNRQLVLFQQWCYQCRPSQKSSSSFTKLLAYLANVLWSFGKILPLGLTSVCEQSQIMPLWHVI